MACMAFILYIDDSGTSPSQRVAIATALIIPAKQITRLESEWESFKRKEGFSDFHTSEFAHRNPKSEFALWNEEKQNRVYARVRQITKKYGVMAVSVSVFKRGYEEVVPVEFRSFTGRHHYTWAVRQLIAYVDKWRASISRPPLQFIFDSMGKTSDPGRKEIVNVMSQNEDDAANQGGVVGDYSNYSFRCRQFTPALQCVDAIGWTCYQHALLLFCKTPLHRLAGPAWTDYGQHRGMDGWLKAFTLTKPRLQKWLKDVLADGRFKKWHEE
jgi:hypothetical protein